MRAGFGKLITAYLQKRENLTNLFILIDSRIKPQQIDLDFITSMGEMGIPFAIIFTKTDKISQKEVMKNIRLMEDEMSKDWVELPPMFLSSAVKMKGKEAILEYIEDINQSIAAQNNPQSLS